MGLYKTKKLLPKKKKSKKSLKWNGNYDCEKIFANHTSEKRLIFKIYKKLIQFNSKNPPSYKWAEPSNRCFSKEYIHMANSKWKDAH